MLCIAGLLFAPTTINETKATLILLPFAVLAPALITPKRFQPLRRLMPVLAIGLVGGLVFIQTYNSFVQYQGTDTIGAIL